MKDPNRKLAWEGVHRLFQILILTVVFLSCRVAHQVHQVQECLLEVEAEAEGKAIGGLPEER